MRTIPHRNFERKSKMSMSKEATKINTGTMCLGRCHTEGCKREIEKKLREDRDGGLIKKKICKHSTNIQKIQTVLLLTYSSNPAVATPQLEAEVIHHENQS
jgi:hypothetical protein